VHLLVFYCLIELLQMHYLIASVVGFSTAIAVNFPLQYFWTFNAVLSHAEAFIKYLTVTLVMLLFNLMILSGLLMLTVLTPLFAQITTIAVAFVVNFSINSLFTFR
jgi:putative flippase GtrA